MRGLVVPDIVDSISTCHPNREVSMKNTVSWSDIETINRLMSKLTEAMFYYHKYSIEAHGAERGFTKNDMNVIVECINLRNKLNQIIDKSK